MDNEQKILQMLTKLTENMDYLKAGQFRIETKLDAVIDQTADLTEFRTKTDMSFSGISDKIDLLQKDINYIGSKSLDTDTKVIDLARRIK